MALVSYRNYYSVTNLADFLWLNYLLEVRQYANTPFITRSERKIFITFP